VRLSGAQDAVDFGGPWARILVEHLGADDFELPHTELAQGTEHVLDVVGVAVHEALREAVQRNRHLDPLGAHAASTRTSSRDADPSIMPQTPGANCMETLRRCSVRSTW
jgi:hypothetical protein